MCIRDSLHTGGLQVVTDLVQEAEALHAAAAHDYHCALAIQILQSVQSALAVIQISG